MWIVIFLFYPVIAYVHYDRSFDEDLTSAESNKENDPFSYKQFIENYDTEPDSSEYDPTPISHQYGLFFPGYESKDYPYPIPYHFEFDNYLDDPDHHYEYAEDHHNLYPESESDPLSHYGYGNGFGYEEYGFDDGKSFFEEDEKSSGEKSDAGHKSEHEHDIADKGNHGKTHHEDFHEMGGQNKESFHDSDDHHDSHHETGKEEEGESSGTSKHHKKGSHTTGFHKIYNKDDYHKNDKFYDDEDKYGSDEKYDNEHSHHKELEGQHKSGEEYDEKHIEGDGGQQQHFDKGHNLEDDVGHNGGSAEEIYHTNHEDYGKKGGDDSAHITGTSSNSQEDDFLVHVY